MECVQRCISDSWQYRKGRIPMTLPNLSHDDGTCHRFTPLPPPTPPPPIPPYPHPFFFFLFSFSFFFFSFSFFLSFLRGYRAQYKTINISGEHRSLPAHMLKVYMYIYMHTYCSVCVTVLHAYLLQCMCVTVLHAYILQCMCVTVLHAYILQCVRYRITCIHIAVRALPCYMHTCCSVCVTVLHAYILQCVRYSATCIHIAVCALQCYMHI